MRAALYATAAGLMLGLAPLDGAPGVALRLLGCLLLAPAVVGRPGADALRGAWAGALWYGTSLLWFPLTWARFDSVGDPWLAYAGLIALQATVPALALGVAGALRARGAPAPLTFALALPASAGIAAVIQPLPAGLAVYLAGHEALLWPAAALGPAGLLAVLGAWVGAWGRPLLLSALTLGWVGVGLLPTPWADGGDPIVVVAIQPNTGPLDARRASTADRRADGLIAAIRDAGPATALVVTPEGAWPHDPGPEGSSRRDRTLAALAGLPPLLLGASVSEGDLATNAALAIEGGAVVGRYDKRRLLPLGERALLGFGRDTYAPGAPLPNPRLAGVPIAVRICYEDLFVGALADLGDAALLATPSNDGWLGPGAGSRAHENASRLAAVATGRWVVRPTTNGRSAVFDPAGRRVASAPWADGDADPPPAATALRVEVRARRPAWSGAAADPWLTALAAAIAAGLLIGRRALSSPSTTPPETDR